MSFEQMNGVFFSQDGKSAIAIKSIVKLHLRHWVPKSIGTKWGTESEHWDVLAAYSVGNETHIDIMFTAPNEFDATAKYQEMVQKMSDFYEK